MLIGDFTKQSSRAADKQPLRKVILENSVMVLSCFAKPTKKLISKTPLNERRGVSLSSVQSLYEDRAEVIITHACETHAQPIEKPIASLAFQLC
jgi:hypothetical protein